MKCVVARLTKIEAEKEKNQGAFEPDVVSRVEKQYTLPKDFEYVLPYNNYLNINFDSRPWNNQGFHWWLGIALHHFEYIISFHEGGINTTYPKYELSDGPGQGEPIKLDITQRDFEEAQKKLDESIYQLALRLESENSMDPHIRSEVRELLRDKHQERDILNKAHQFQEDDTTRQIQFSVTQRKELELEIDIYEHLKRRSAAVHGAATEARETIRARKVLPNLGPVSDFIKSLYTIICLFEKDNDQTEEL